MFDKDVNIVENLLSNHDGFRRLHEQHRALKRQVHDATYGSADFDDLILGAIKKKKLRAKDQMEAMIAQYRRLHS